MKIKSIMFVLLAGLALVSFGHAKETFVDQSGAGDFVSIQAAVDGSPDGTLIIIRGGIYEESVTLIGRSLRLVAQEKDSVTIVGKVSIQNLNVTQSVSVIDLVIGSFTNPTNGLATLRVFNCEGPVRVQGCEIDGVFAPLAPGAGRAVQVVNSTRVSVISSSLRGGSGDPVFGGNGATGLTLQDSRLAAWDLEVIGGAGGNLALFDFGPGPIGGSGIQANGSHAFLSGCTVRGGMGGWSINPTNTSGMGGHGINYNSASEFVFLGSTVEGGEPGSIAGGTAGPGQMFSGAGTSQFLGGVARHLVSPTLVRAGQTETVTVAGPRSSAARLVLTQTYPYFWDLYPQASPTIGSRGLATPSQFPIAVIPLGVVPSSGILTANVSMPSLPPGVATDSIIAIGISGNGAADHLLAEPREIVLIECQTLTPDCNGNGQADICDLVSGLESDCDANGLPDSCQPDCNGNGQADSCDISSGISLDLTADGIPDECQGIGGNIWHVDPTSGPGGDGSFAAPFETINEALSAAYLTDEIVLFDGIYAGVGNVDLSLDLPEISIRSLGGPANCVVDLGGQSFFLNVDLTGVPTTRSFLLNGLTVKDGSASALLVTNCEARIVNCVFENNQTSEWGGAIRHNTAYALGSSVSVNDCTFQGNSSLGFHGGGALYHVDEIISCSFISNTSSTRGGAISLHDFSQNDLMVANSSFLANHADGEGGAIFCARPNLVQQCLFAGNSATEGGALFFSYNSVLECCTIVNNTAVASGGGLQIGASGSGQGTPNFVRNSILAGNSAGSGGEFYIQNTGTAIFLSYSTVDGGLSDAAIENNAWLGTIDVVYALAPVFVDPDGPDNDPLTVLDNNYRLGTGAVQIDSGSNGLLSADTFDLDGDGDILEPIPTDRDGNPRKADDPNAPDLGSGPAPIVDQGAFERQ